MTEFNSPSLIGTVTEVRQDVNLVTVEMADGSVLNAKWLPNGRPVVGLGVVLNPTDSGGYTAVAKNAIKSPPPPPDKPKIIVPQPEEISISGLLLCLSPDVFLAEDPYRLAERPYYINPFYNGKTYLTSAPAGWNPTTAHAAGVDCGSHEQSLAHLAFRAREQALAEAFKERNEAIYAARRNAYIAGIEAANAPYYQPGVMGPEGYCAPPDNVRSCSEPSQGNFQSCWPGNRSLTGCSWVVYSVEGQGVAHIAAIAAVDAAYAAVEFDRDTGEEARRRAHYAAMALIPCGLIYFEQAYRVKQRAVDVMTETEAGLVQSVEYIRPEDDSNILPEHYAFVLNIARLKSSVTLVSLEPKPGDKPDEDGAVNSDFGSLVTETPDRYTYTDRAFRWLIPFLRQQQIEVNFTSLENASVSLDTETLYLVTPDAFAFNPYKYGPYLERNGKVAEFIKTASRDGALVLWLVDGLSTSRGLEYLMEATSIEQKSILGLGYGFITSETFENYPPSENLDYSSSPPSLIGSKGSTHWDRFDIEGSEFRKTYAVEPWAIGYPDTWTRDSEGRVTADGVVVDFYFDVEGLLPDGVAARAYSMLELDKLKAVGDFSRYFAEASSEALDLTASFYNSCGGYIVGLDESDIVATDWKGNAVMAYFKPERLL